MESPMCLVECTYDKGIFENEYAVEIHMGGDESISLFAWKNLVKNQFGGNKGYLQAQMLEQGKDFDVVILPSETIESGRSIVKVPSRLVTTP